jgi:cobalt-zinc-cadmium efflux system membrane fusion protein
MRIEMHKLYRPLLWASVVALMACSPKPQGEHPVTKETVKDGAAAQPESEDREKGEQSEKKGGAGDDDDKERKKNVVKLSDAQIKAAGITVAPVRRAFVGAVESPGTIVASPARSEVIAAAVTGRIVSLPLNLGQLVRRGDTLAIIESREAADLKADLESARRQLRLAEQNLEREDRLYREKVTAEQEYQTVRTTAEEARIRVRLAMQRLAAVGGAADGPLNRLVLRSPINGYVIARPAVLGNVVEANAELLRVADLSEVSVDLPLAPDDASKVATGSTVEVTTGGRSGTGKIAYVSPVFDQATRQVQALATLPNPGGTWRIGETVRASIVPKHTGKKEGLAVPEAALQNVEGKPSVFVRVKDGFVVKPIIPGPASEGYIKVVTGLNGDEQVAVNNSYVLKAELNKGEGGDDD